MTTEHFICLMLAAILGNMLGQMLRKWMIRIFNPLFNKHCDYCGKIISKLEYNKYEGVCKSCLDIETHENEGFFQK